MQVKTNRLHFSPPSQGTSKSMSRLPKCGWKWRYWNNTQTRIYYYARCRLSCFTRNLALTLRISKDLSNDFTNEIGQQTKYQDQTDLSSLFLLKSCLISLRYLTQISILRKVQDRLTDQVTIKPLARLDQ